MRNHLLLLSCGLFLAAFAPKWLEFKSPTGKFAVKVPLPLTEKVASTTTAIGKLDYHTFHCQVPESAEPGNLVYLVSFCDYPPESVHSDSTDLLKEFFAATIESSAKSIRGEVLYQADCRIEGFPGKIWRVDYNNGEACMKTKSVMVKNRLYTLQTACKRIHNLNSDSDRFFNSFRLLP